VHRLAALGVLAGVLVACGDAGPTGGDRPTTTATAAVDLDADWSRPCQDTSDATASGGNGRGAATFGRLGAEPSLVVHLPLARLSPEVTDPTEVDRWPVVSPTRLHDGVAITLAPPATSDAASSVLVVVNDDGAVRWVRCIDGTIEGLAASEDPDVDSVLVAVRAGAGNATSEQGTRWMSLAVADGEDLDLDLELDADEVYAMSGQMALLAARDWDEITPHGLELYDLVAVTAEPVELPPEAANDNAGPARFGFEPTGDLVQYASGLADLDVVTAVWRDGAWVRDVAATDGLHSIRAGFDYGRDGGAVLVAASATGTPMWEQSVRDPGREGRTITQDDRTVVAWACGERQADDLCSIAVVGVDLASGQILWTDPDADLVGVGGDGYVLLGSASGWFLHDMRTGERVAGQRWADPAAFLEGCCDEARFRYVKRVGGTVFVVDGDEVRIWFPEGSSYQRRDRTVP
jgi:hypothetical protein